MRLVRLILHPKAEFAEIATHPSFVLPWFLASILVAAPMWMALQRMSAVRLFGQAAAMFQNNPQLAGATVDEIAEAFALLFRIFAVVVPVLAIPLTAVCLIPFVSALGGKAGFRPLMAVTAWAAVPPAIGMALTVTLVLLLRDPARLSFESLTPLNLGVLIPARVSPLLHNIASTLEFFSAWSVWLISEGIVAASRTGAGLGLSFRRVLLALALPLIVLAWLLAALAALL